MAQMNNRVNYCTDFLFCHSLIFYQQYKYFVVSQGTKKLNKSKNNIYEQFTIRLRCLCEIYLNVAMEWLYIAIPY